MYVILDHKYLKFKYLIDDISIYRWSWNFASIEDIIITNSLAIRYSKFTSNKKILTSLKETFFCHNDDESNINKTLRHKLCPTVLFPRMSKEESGLGFKVLSNLYGKYMDGGN